MPKEKTTTPERRWARVTVSMAGVHRGQHVLVDPADPDIAELIANRCLVLETDDDDGK